MSVLDVDLFDQCLAIRRKFEATLASHAPGASASAP
jgi:hypothetical protein